MLGVACLQDWTVRLVANRIPAGIAVLALGLRGLDGTVLPGLLACGCVFAAALFCWRRGWLGGADVKLLAAAALLLPPAAAPDYVLATCVAGGVLALLYAAAGFLVPAPRPGPRPHSLLARYWRMEQRRLRRRGPLPYATAITAGVAIILTGG